MKSLLLLLCLSFTFISSWSMAAEVVLSKSQFIDYMKTALPNAFCAEKQYFRKCFKVTEDVCLSEAMRATKVCILSMEGEMPEKFHQPKDGADWGTKMGTCAGTNYEVSLTKSKIDSADCKDPSKWK